MSPPPGLLRRSAEINLSRARARARARFLRHVNQARVTANIPADRVIRKTDFIRSCCFILAFLAHDFCCYLSRRCGRGGRYSCAYPNRAVHVTRKLRRADNISSWKEEAGRFVTCSTREFV